MKIRKIVMLSLLTALCTVATILIYIPSPTGGYVNVGDVVVILSGFLLGPVNGAIAAGVGSALADIILGAPIYAPATLIIKALMAFVAALIYRSTGKNTISIIVSALIAEGIMTVGYILYDAFLLKSLVAAATGGILGSIAQSIAGFVGSFLLAKILKKNKYICREFPSL